LCLSFKQLPKEEDTELIKMTLFRLIKNKDESLLNQFESSFVKTWKEVQESLAITYGVLTKKNAFICEV